MKFLIYAMLLLASVAHARGEAGRVRLCREGVTPVGVDVAKTVLVLDGLIRFETPRTGSRPASVRDKDLPEMQVVTEIIEPLRPGPECRVLLAWVADNPSNEPLPRAGATWRGFAFADYGRLVDVPPRVIGVSSRVTRVAFEPYKPWEGGRVLFTATALDDFKPMPLVDSRPPVLPKPVERVARQP